MNTQVLSQHVDALNPEPKYVRVGLEISSERICLPGHPGAGAHVAPYTLKETSRQRALQLIGEA